MHKIATAYCTIWYEPKKMCAGIGLLYTYNLHSEENELGPHSRQVPALFSSCVCVCVRACVRVCVCVCVNA